MKKSKLLLASTVSATVIAASVMPAFALSREETVYSKLDTSGKNKNTIVSEQLKNDEKSKEIKDTTDLSKVVNVNGNEKYSKSGDTYTWTAKGKDIYYQGKTDKELPITMNIVYKLNGKETNLKDMYGKKGDITIEITYTNNSKKEINGKTLYTPFVVTTGTMLPTDKNSNVSVTNGKVVSNGKSNIVAAIATPGLQEDFDNTSALDGLNKITISYTTTKFELNSIMTFASAKLIEANDLTIFDKMDNIYSMIDTFASSYSQILSGGKTLQGAVNELNNSYSQFNSAVSTASSGSKQLSDGLVQVDSGISGIDEGAKTLDSTIGELQTKSKELNSGAQQVNAGVEQAKQGVATLSSQSSTLRAGAKQLRDGTINQVNTQLAPIFSAAGVTTPLTADNYAGILDALIANPALATYKTQLETAKATIENVVKFSAGVDQYTTGVDQLNASLPTLAAGSKQVSDGTSTLASSSDKLKAGTSSLKGATSKLKAGTNKLNSSSKKLASGLGLISVNSNKILSATGQLKSGANQLVAGMTKFDEEGVQKLVNLINNDVKTNVEKVKDLTDLANEYDTFASKDANMKSSTKFIMIIDGKKK